MERLKRIVGKFQFLQRFQCNIESKAKIAEFLQDKEKNNLLELDQSETDTLRQKIQPKCKNGHNKWKIDSATEIYDCFG